MRYLLLLLSFQVYAETTVYVTQSPSVPYGYIISNNPQPYAISTPKTPDLKPICAGYGKDYATTQWLACARDGKLNGKQN